MCVWLSSDSDYNLKRKDAEWTEELKTLQEVRWLLGRQAITRNSPPWKALETLLASLDAHPIRWTVCFVAHPSLRAGGVCTCVCVGVQENKKNLQFERSRFDELQGRFEHMMLEHMQQAEKRDHDHSEALRVSQHFGITGLQLIMPRLWINFSE